MIPNCLRNESGMHDAWLPDMVRVEGAMTLLCELCGGDDILDMVVGAGVY